MPLQSQGVCRNRRRSSFGWHFQEGSQIDEVYTRFSGGQPPAAGTAWIFFNIKILSYLNIIRELSEKKTMKKRTNSSKNSGQPGGREGDCQGQRLLLFQQGREKVCYKVDTIWL